MPTASGGSNQTCKIGQENRAVLLAMLANRSCLQKAFFKILTGDAAVPRWEPHELNLEAFAEPLSREARYWVGFLLADGSIHGKSQYKPAIRLALAVKDYEHVRKFASFVGIHEEFVHEYKKVSNYGNNDVAWLQFSSAEMCQQLAKYCVVPNKSGNEVVPDSLALDVDFWRGVIDGDGNVRMRPKDNIPCLTLTGSWKLIDKFADFLLEIAGKRPAVSQNHSIYQLGIGGSRARATLSKIYYDGCSPVLDRKMVEAERCKAWLSKYRGEIPREIEV